MTTPDLAHIEGTVKLIVAEAKQVRRYITLIQEDLGGLREKDEELDKKIANLELLHVELRNALIDLRTDLDKLSNYIRENSGP
jgi:chromosome segregation ATPase